MNKKMGNNKIKINLLELTKEWNKNTEERLTLRKLSKETGIRPNTLINFRDNKFKRVEKDHIEKLLDFFGCDIHDLFILDK
jgi:DNA-binding Xre family transcriptional regulator